MAGTTGITDGRMLRRARIASAEAGNINPSCISQVLRMTLLAPEIVEAILAGKQPEGLMTARAMQLFPDGWHDQRKILQISGCREPS